MIRLVASLAIILVLMFSAADLYAATVELWPETYFQLQQYRDVDRLKVDKTRFTQYLTFNLFEEAEVPRHRFFASFRIDVDLGTDASPDVNPNPLAYQSMALLYAYWEWRRIGDAVDLTVGRQIVADELGMAALDGVRVVVRRNWYVGLDLHAGLEVKGGLNLEEDGFYLPNSDTFEPDGTIGDDLTTGAFGAAAFLDGVEDTDLRVQYRHLYSGETDGQKAGVVFRQRLFDVWELYTLDDFNILMERFSQLHFGTGLNFGWIAVNVDHWASNPDFDGDSIFNFFPIYAEKELALSLYFAMDDKTRFNLGYSRLHQGDTSIVFDDWGHEGNASHMARFSAWRRLGEYTDLRLNWSMNRGWGGDTQRFLLGAGSYVWNRHIRLDAAWMGTYYSQLLYTDVLEKLANTGFSWGFYGQSEFRLHPEVSILLQGEVSSNRYIERQFALFSVLDVHMWL
ncbi:MAG: hypothetical protein C4523_17395 [Myxococcales bacterium]|nr:MAG: hypothetical protein C4523_17395 [Myxococcales bacterium]